METVLEKQTMIENAEKEKHNAMINERYRRLLDAVEDQMSAPVETGSVYAPAYVSETPTVEQEPTVTEYAPSAVASSVFTAEKFERLGGITQQNTQAVSIPVAAQPRTITKIETATAARYSLTPLAKIAMAVFTLVVVAMLTLIGINSQILRRKSIRLKNLEQKKEQLLEQKDELQRRIQELQTEENIIERATAEGLLN